jgi:hypothetical protein
LTGSQSGHILQDCRILDVSPDITKWKRLYDAFVESQNTRRCDVHQSSDESGAVHIASPGAFSARRDEFNAVLAFCGMMITEDGKVRHAPRAEDLDEALARANRLKAALVARNVHDDVLLFCRGVAVFQIRALPQASLTRAS